MARTFAASDLRSDVRTKLNNVLEQVFNVKHPDYGALGDNDDDTAAIQAAIDAAQTAGGGIVYFPPGIYRLTSSLVFRNVVPGTGSALVALRGAAPSEDDYNGSRILGNVSTGDGFLISQNDEQIVTITGLSGTFTLGETVTGGTSGAVAPLDRKISTTGLVFLGTGFGTYQVAETVTGASSGATATVSAVSLGQRGLVEVSDLYIKNENTTSGGGLKIDGTQGARISNCNISGFVGLRMGSNAYSAKIQSCKFSGPGNAAGSVGLIMLQADVNACDFLGWDTAIRHSNIGGAVRSCRIETCYTGIQTGKDRNNENAPSGAFVVEQLQTERVDTGVVFFNIVTSSLRDCQVTGSINVDGDGDLTNGFTFAGVDSCSVENCEFSGEATSAGFLLSGANLLNLSFRNCKSTNGGSGGTWSLSNASANKYKFENCNNPTAALAFADLPTSVVEGDRSFITNCSHATFGTDADGGGSNNVPVYYNGSSWKVG
jgi:hypothetical protein